MAARAILLCPGSRAAGLRWLPILLAVLLEGGCKPRQVRPQVCGTALWERQEYQRSGERCAAGELQACVSEADLISQGGYFVPTDRARARELYARACAGGVSAACERVTALIALEYCNSAGFYVCYLNGIADGATASCTPTKSDNPLRCSTDQFSVSYTFPPYTDGLRVTTIGATVNGTSYSVEKFTNAYVKLDCSGCSGSFDNANCNACWIDSDDHGKCLTMQVTMDSYGTATCSDPA